MDYLSYLYTPQQMSGGASFGHSTRVGNWSEDYELQQHRIKVRRCFSFIPPRCDASAAFVPRRPAEDDPPDVRRGPL